MKADDGLPTVAECVSVAVVDRDMDTTGAAQS